MAPLPIDLQTNFTQSTKVGQEQAIQKDASLLAQSLQASQTVQKAAQRDKAVNETQHQEDGAERVKDRARRGAERGQGKQKRKGKKPPVEPAPPTVNVVKDPALGRKIDITS
jgi:hypothetical protein